ncbi:MAG: cadherin-like domain-containing protein, partial [Prochlorococcus marinus CUG1432]|nr:cadherin-like domain-containing protein [Prochlorococcus marinus CUG1432]
MDNAFDDENYNITQDLDLDSDLNSAAYETDKKPINIIEPKEIEEYDYSKSAYCLTDDLYIFGNSIYSVVGGQGGNVLSWFTSELEANAIGGHLVTINDLEENNFISEKLSAEVDDKSLWIGYHWGKSFMDRGEPIADYHDPLPVFGATSTGGKWISGEITASEGYIGDKANFTNTDITNMMWIEVFGTYSSILLDDIKVEWGGSDLGEFIGFNAYPITNNAGSWGHFTNDLRTQDLSGLPVNGLAEIPYYQFEDSIYFELGASTWSEAKEQAEKLGGNLVSINSVEENQFLWETFAENNNSEIGKWIGLTNKENNVEGNLQWADGSQITIKDASWSAFSNDIQWADSSPTSIDFSDFYGSDYSLWVSNNNVYGRDWASRFEDPSNMSSSGIVEVKLSKEFLDWQKNKETITSLIDLGSIDEDNNLIFTKSDLLLNDSGELISSYLSSITDLKISKGEGILEINEIFESEPTSWKISPKADWNGDIEISYGIQENSNQNENSILFNKDNWFKPQEIRIKYDSFEDLPKTSVDLFLKNTSTNDFIDQKIYQGQNTLNIGVNGNGFGAPQIDGWISTDYSTEHSENGSIDVVVKLTTNSLPLNGDLSFLANFNEDPTRVLGSLDEDWVNIFDILRPGKGWRFELGRTTPITSESDYNQYFLVDSTTSKPTWDEVVEVYEKHIANGFGGEIQNNSPIIFNKENWFKPQEIRIKYDSFEDLPKTSVDLFFENTSTGEFKDEKIYKHQNTLNIPVNGNGVGAPPIDGWISTDYSTEHGENGSIDLVIKLTANSLPLDGDLSFLSKLGEDSLSLGGEIQNNSPIIFNKENWFKPQEIRIKY